MAPVESRDYVLSGISYSILEPRRCVKHKWLVNTPSKHKTLTQCWSNAGPPSEMLVQHQTSTGSTSRVCWGAFNSSWSGSTYCWRRLQTDTNPMFVKCLASVAGAGQYPFSSSQYFMLAGARALSAWRAVEIAKWKYLLISQVCIYRLLGGL